MATIQEFVVLYTKHKIQKAKKWQDGVLKFNTTNRKGSLYDEKGKDPLESKFFSKDEVVDVGSELETESYLITIEGVKESNCEAKFVPTTHTNNNSSRIQASIAVARQPFKPPIGNSTLGQRTKRRQPSLEERLANQELLQQKAKPAQDPAPVMKINNNNYDEDRFKPDTFVKGANKKQRNEILQQQADSMRLFVDDEPNPIRWNSTPPNNFTKPQNSHQPIQNNNNNRSQNNIMDSDYEPAKTEDKTDNPAAVPDDDNLISMYFSNNANDEEEEKVELVNLNDVSVGLDEDIPQTGRDLSQFLALFAAKSAGASASAKPAPQKPPITQSKTPQVSTPTRPVHNEEPHYQEEPQLHKYIPSYSLNHKDFNPPSSKPKEKDDLPSNVKYEQSVGLIPADELSFDDLEVESTNMNVQKTFKKLNTQHKKQKPDHNYDEPAFRHAVKGKPVSPPKKQRLNDDSDEDKPMFASSLKSLIQNTTSNKPRTINYGASNPIKPASNNNNVPTKSFKSPLHQVKKPGLWDPAHPEVVFPSHQALEEYSMNGKVPARHLKVPDRFESLEEYAYSWTCAINEEINLMLFKLAVDYLQATKRLSQRGGASSDSLPKCLHGVAVMRTSQKEGKNKGRMFYTCPAPRDKQCPKMFHWVDEWEKKSGAKPQAKPRAQAGPIELTEPNLANLRSNGFKVYANCEFIKSMGQNSIRDHFAKGNKKTPAYDPDMPFKPGWYIRVSWKEKSTDYSKGTRKITFVDDVDDLWILCTSTMFSVNSVHDSIYLVRSVYHGPARSGLLEVKPLSGNCINVKGKVMVHAIRFPYNLSTELSMIDNLASLADANLPILPLLLHGNELEHFAEPGPPKKKKIVQYLTNSNNDLLAENPFELSITSQEMTEIAEEFINKYKLNVDQAKVMHAVTKWFQPNDGIAPSMSLNDVLLVHGIFGSGKSFLLVVIILFFSKLCDICGNTSARILVKAVDRVLLGLVKENFTDFVRVGSLRKIAKPILQYTLQSSDDKEALRDLQSMLKDPFTPTSEVGEIQRTIEEIKSGHMKQREEKLNQVRVVGVTCAASVFPILESSLFPIVFLDECSQMLEPLSLIPLARFRCSKLLAVGDPMQLPPTLNSFGDEKESSEGLAKTLFVRLSKIGFEPIMLRTQYRCHPTLSQIANSLFYSYRLLDGVTHKDRSPILPDFPALMFCNDDRGVETRDRFGSYYNEFEAKTIAELVTMCLSQGIKGHQIGIIALYKAQVAKLIEVLGSLSVDLPQEDDLGRELDDLLDDEVLEDDSDGEGFSSAKNLRSSAKKQTKNKKDQQLSHPLLREIQVSTVDAFQGAEKEIIILACSRTTGLGFSDSPKRLNVAITRAKRHLFIVGKAKTLATENIWKTILERAKDSSSIGLQSSAKIVDNRSIQSVGCTMQELFTVNIPVPKPVGQFNSDEMMLDNLSDFPFPDEDELGVFGTTKPTEQKTSLPAFEDDFPAEDLELLNQLDQVVEDYTRTKKHSPEKLHESEE